MTVVVLLNKLMVVIGVVILMTCGLENKLFYRTTCQPVKG